MDHFYNVEISQTVYHGGMSRSRAAPARTLTAEKVLAAAGHLLETRGPGAVTMRGVARLLGVDPMAAYHYFQSRDALLEALGQQVYAALDPASPPFAHNHPWRTRVTRLALHYLTLVLAAPRHTQAVVEGRLPVHSPATRFQAVFDLAVADLGLPLARRRLAAHTVVDLVHGFALAPGTSQRALVAQLALLLDGLAAWAGVRASSNGARRR